MLLMSGKKSETLKKRGAGGAEKIDDTVGTQRQHFDDVEGQMRVSRSDLNRAGNGRDYVLSHRLSRLRTRFTGTLLGNSSPGTLA